VLIMIEVKLMAVELEVFWRLDNRRCGSSAGSRCMHHHVIIPDLLRMVFITLTLSRVQ